MNNWEKVEGADSADSARGQAEKWFTPGRFTWLLAGIIVARFPKVIFGQETFFYRDYGLFTYPVAHFCRECFWRGEFPLWNPYNNFGVPVLAQWNTSVLYPPSLFYLLLPLTWSLAVFNLLHLVFAGLGMYLLARRWTGNQPAASAAGMAFAINGLSLHMLMWISNLAAWAWMPWVVLAVERAWATPKIRPLIVATVAGAMQMLAGAPELILLTWIFLGVMWAAKMFRGEAPRVSLFWRTVVICGLIAGLCAAQLLPFMELLAHSQRDTSYGDSKWAMPVWGWADFIVPLFHCSPSIIGIFSQNEQQWTSSYYLSIGAVALALMALWRRRDARVVGLAIAVLAGVVLAMGENAPIYGALKRVLPLLGIMRYPIKIVVLTVFSLPLLAAFGLSGKNEATPSEVRKNAYPIVAGGIILLLLLAGILIYARHFPLPDEHWLVTRESGMTRAVFLVLVLIAAWVVGRAPSARAVGLAGFSIVLLLAVDAFTHTPNQNPTLPAAIYAPLDNPQLSVRPGDSRAMVHPQLQAFLLHSATEDPLKYYLGQRRALFLNCNLIDDLPTTSGFFSLELRSAAQVGAILNAPNHIFPDALADFAGVSRISSPDTSFAWTNRTSFMPLVTAGQKPIFASHEETLKALASQQFDPRTTVYLPLDAKEAVNIPGTTNVAVSASKFSTRKLSCEVQAGTPALLVIAQAYYGPWHAYVDGNRTALWEANGAFQALMVPAGKHQVELAYEDAAFHWGMVISALTLLVTGLVWFRFGRQTAGA